MADSHDLINMTELWLEYDQKIFTMTNINIGTWPKNSQQRMLTVGHFSASVLGSNKLKHIELPNLNSILES